MSGPQFRFELMRATKEQPNGKKPMVWWWTVTRDGVKVPNTTGWDWKRGEAHIAAVKQLRRAKAEEAANR